MVSELRAAGRSTDVATNEAAVWSAFYKATHVGNGDQIAAARSRSGDSGPVFAAADMLGLTPEQFDRFMKARAAAEAEAEARVTAEVMAPLRRQREAWYREERAKVAEEVERQVNAMPVFRALEWLGNRRWLGEGGPGRDAGCAAVPCDPG